MPAPISISWIEIEFESRPWTLSRTGGPSQEIHLIVTSDGFLDEAEEQTIPGTETILYQDDEIMQSEVIPYFVNIFGSLVKKFYLDPTKYILLYVMDIQATQINWSQWKLVISFGIPEDNGQSQGGGGGETGPSDGEKNSEEFTQMSFNCTTSMENRQQATLYESQVAVGRSEAVTDTAGRLRFIGVTEDGIKGADVPVRGFSFQIVQYMPPTKLTYAYMRRLSRLTACLNSNVFFGFAPYSVMCSGAQAGGHLYQNIPVTLEFDVKTNFKFSQAGPSSLAPLDDVIITGQDGKKTVNTTLQYDTYYDPDFPDTAITQTAVGLANGVHSGWSIVEYLYAPQVKVTSKTIIRKPTERRIFLPEETLVIDFNNFLL